MLARALLMGALGACTAAPLVQIEVPVLPMSNSPCSAVVERLEHLDQPSALGFSAVELLARVAGESASPLVWLRPEANIEYTLAYGPESGRSSVQLRVLPAVGEVRYRHELMSDDAPEGTECADGVLEVPVTVSIQSDTQALDETFSTHLEASSVYRARFSHTFAPGTLSGGFSFTEVSSLDPERAFSAGPLSLQVVVWEDGSQGSLSTEIQSRYTPNASAAAREASPVPTADSPSLALWPSAEACSVPTSSRLPSDAKVLGFSVSDVLEALAAEGTHALTWSTGDSTALELDFVTPASELCQTLGDSLAFDTTVRVRTSDGRLSAEVPVQINASNEGGTLGEVTVQTMDGAPAVATLTSFRRVAGQRVGRKGGRGSSGALEPSDIRVDLDASFRTGLSAGTVTLSGIDTATTGGDPASAPSRELASGRWAH